MTNDNKTALQESIQRKKDRIEKTMMSEFEKQILEREIAEDEKLLTTDKEHWVRAYVQGRQDMRGFPHGTADENSRKQALKKFTQKYGSDE